MEERSMTPIPRQTLKRMPQYLQTLKKLRDAGAEIVSAPTVAAQLGLNDVQVRKDFAAVSSRAGRPKTGFDIHALIADIESCLGYNNTHDAVLVGAGSLGRALLSYRGFEAYALRIVAAFDTDPAVIGTEIAGKRVLPLEKLPSLCRRMGIHIGIITVPADNAQAVCDLLVGGGVRAVWNFAPTRLEAPDGILIQSENMAASLAVLSNHLSEQM